MQVASTSSRDACLGVDKLIDVMCVLVVFFDKKGVGELSLEELRLKEIKSEQNCSKNFITLSHKRGGEVEHAGDAPRLHVIR